MEQSHTPPMRYIADSESLTEMARLITQDRLLTKEMGVIFAEEQWSSFERVLDLGCGPGGWCLDMAHRYPHVQFVGVDKSQRMIAYANMLAQAERLDNVRFLEMDASQQFHLPEATFDLVNGRLLYSFLPAAHWPTFLRECLRVIKPGGWICLTEWEFICTNSAAQDRLMSILSDAIFRAGRSFSQSGKHLGVTCMLKPLLQEAGFREIYHKGWSFDYSFGQPGAAEWREDTAMMGRTFQSFVVASGAITADENEQLLTQALAEMATPQFAAMAYFLTALGQKRSE